MPNSYPKKKKKLHAQWLVGLQICCHVFLLSNKISLENWEHTRTDQLLQPAFNTKTCPIHIHRHVNFPSSSQFWIFLSSSLDFSPVMFNPLSSSDPKLWILPSCWCLVCLIFHTLMSDKCFFVFDPPFFFSPICFLYSQSNNFPAAYLILVDFWGWCSLSWLVIHSFSLI